MRVEKIGDWDKIISKLRGFSQFFTMATDKLAELVAKEFLSYLKDAIESQRFDLPPLTKEYLQRKVDSGLDPRLLIATREYIDKLKVMEVNDGRRTRFVIGGSKEDKHEGTDADMASLVQWLEEGTALTPARPHFGPAWDEFWSSAKGRLFKLLQSQINLYWR